MAEGTLLGRLQGDRVQLGPDALTDLHDQGHFGRSSEDGLELSLVEAAYLIDRSKIRVLCNDKELDFKAFFQLSSSLESGFEFRYVVYKDLRERGYYIQPGKPDFRIYPRGGHPGKTPAEFYVLVVSERTPLPLRELLRPVKISARLRKKLMLAIVDEESDITFYEARVKSLAGKMEIEELEGRATMLEDRVVIWDEDSSSRLHRQGFYGQPVGGRLQLSLVESAYLLEKGMIQLADRDGSPLDLASFKNRARNIEQDFDLKFLVYKDLRDLRLVVKTGFKFGSHFRVYRQVESLEKVPHSEYLVHIVPNDHIFNLPAMSRAVRLAHSVRKQMVYAYPDGGANYLEIRRLRP